MTSIGFYEIFGVLFAFLLFFIIPFILTVNNIRSLFSKKYRSNRRNDLITIFWGLVCSCGLLFITCDEITSKDYFQPVYPNELHSMLHTEYGITIDITIFLAYLGMIVLCLIKPERLSPIISAVSIASIFPGAIAAIFIYIQLAKNLSLIDNLMLYLYPINLLMIAARQIRFHITEHVRLVKERDTQFRSKFAMFLSKIMSKVSSMTIFSFLLILPVAAILEILFILLGQGPDGFIKAFTMTADWTFSTQTPPPPMEYEGHYLCTVAAGGHKNVVKPIRYGKRLGTAIVVNRQLLAANAFEDLIKEKLPRFHKSVRSFYDKHGYPLSRHITAPYRADAVYILMKPLEFIFIGALYLFDVHPENRIAVQYSDYRGEI